MCEREADKVQFVNTVFEGVPKLVVRPFYLGRQTPTHLTTPLVGDGSKEMCHHMTRFDFFDYVFVFILCNL